MSAVEVIDHVVPKNGGNFASVWDTDVQGGYSIVADTTARDAIRSGVRKEGMWVKTLSDGKIWTLGSDLTTWTEQTFGTLVNLPTNPGDNGKVAIAASGNLSYALLADANVASNAAIAVSKLAKGAANQVLVTDSGAITAQWASLANANIASNAAIAVSKLALGAANQVLVTDSGVTTAQWALLSDANLATGAAVAVTKLANGTAGQVLTTAGTTPTWATIVDANVSSTAAIAGTKISPNFGSQSIVTTGTISIGSAPAATGDFRTKNAFTFKALNQLGTTDYQLFTFDASNILRLGDSTNQPIIALDTTVMRFGATMVNPTFTQNSSSTASATGQQLTVQAQVMTGTASVGGKLMLQSGTGVSANGDVEIQRGTTSVLIFNGTTANFAANGIVTTGYVSAGTTPAASGDIRIPALGTVKARNSGNSADIQLITANSSGSVVVGNGAASWTLTSTTLTSGVNSIDFSAGLGGLGTTCTFKLTATASVATGGTLQILGQDVSNPTGPNTAGALLNRAGDCTVSSNNTGGKATYRGGNASGGTTNVGGDCEILVGTGSTRNGNLTLVALTGGTLTGGGNIFVGNAGALPTADPVTGFYLSSNSGVPRWRTAAGNIIEWTSGTATTASTGANGAPPAQVAGYVTAIINGTNAKIPYYNT